MSAVQHHVNYNAQSVSVYLGTGTGDMIQHNLVKLKLESAVFEIYGVEDWPEISMVSSPAFQRS